MTNTHGRIPNTLIGKPYRVYNRRIAVPTCASEATEYTCAVRKNGTLVYTPVHP
jgi:hypothetical protein